MKRALVFLVAAPISVFVATFFLGAAAGGKSPGFIPVVATAMAIVTLSVAMLAGTLDAFLVRALAITLRAPLVAAVGAIIASGLTSGLVYVVFNHLLPQEPLAYVAIGGATCMGLCSLLANDYSCQGAMVQANSLLRK
ncbi:MAG TPA: hypothetical protein VJR30_03950 [Bradyrhizobium sp.]|nr:hypothetical protein [Bradyrhizobium sp.]